MGIINRGKYGSDIDALQLKAGLNKNRQRKLEQAMAAMPGATSGTVGAALPAQPFILASRTRNKGCVVTMAFLIDQNTTSVICRILAAKDNVGTDKSAIHSKAIEKEWADITDDERAAKFCTREFRPALEYDTIYKVVQTVAINDADGTKRQVRLPDMNPYTTVPITAFVKRYDQNRNPLANDACFQTASSDTPTMFVDGCAGAETVMFVPRPHPTYVTAQKINAKGVKPTLQLLVHKKTRSLRVVLIRHDEIGTSTDAFDEKIGEQLDIDPASLGAVVGVTANPGEDLTDARVVKFRFHKPLDYNAVYDTVLLVARGDNVGGQGQDEVKNPVAGTLAIIPGGTFTAGQLSDGVNADLAPDNPFVSTTLMNGAPIDYVIKRSHVKAMMHFLIPAQTTTLTARIEEHGNPTKTLSDTWDDITDAERTAKKCSRLFGERLDFNQQYDLIRLAAEGADIGGTGVDKARTPAGALANPPATLASFTTPDADGTFNGGGGNLLQFVGITKRKYKKNGNGVKVTMKINAPKGTERITARICKISDAASADAVLDYTFEDCADEIQANGFIEREFGEKLDPTTTAGELNYGIVRLIAEGPGVNSGLQGGNNPDVYRNNKTKPVVPYTFIDNGGTVRTFSTTNPISFTGATVPAVPLLSDLINLIENDEAKVSFPVIASSFRNTINSGGTGPNGVVTFADVGASEAFVIVNRAGQAGDSGTVDKQKFSVPVDPTATTATIELEGLKTGKQYYIPRVGLQSGTDIAKTPAASPLTSIVFRAGFDISLSGVTLTVGQPLAVDSRSSLVPVTYNIPSGSVLPRNLQLFKDIAGKTGGFKEAATAKVLKDSQDNATAGSHPFFFDSTHPANAQIRYKAILNPVKGGGNPVIAYFPLGNGDPTPAIYDLTSDDPAVTDTAPPAYSAGNTVTAADPRFKFKASLLRFGCNFPDRNNKTLRTKFYLFVYTQTVSGAVQTYFLNPNADPNDGAFVAYYDSTNFGFPGNPGPFFIELGRTSAAPFAYDKPDATSFNGDIPAVVMNSIRNAVNSTDGLGRFGFAYIQANFQFQNDAGILTVNSGQLNFNSSTGFPNRVTGGSVT